MKEKILQLHTEKNIFWTLAGILLLCAGFYTYSITTTIHNVVERQNLENKASTLTLAIGANEFKYISMRNAITLSYAQSLGFSESHDKIFLSRTSGDASTHLVSYLSRN